jgi:hypothetical protein
MRVARLKLVIAMVFLRVMGLSFRGFAVVFTGIGGAEHWRDRQTTRIVQGAVRPKPQPRQGRPALPQRMIDLNTTGMSQNSMLVPTIPTAGFGLGLVSGPAKPGSR